MTRVMCLWRGDLSLDSAFWNWAVLGGLLVNATTTGLCLFLITSGRPIAALAVGYGISVPYNVVVAVGVWRSAGRYAGDPRWGRLARIVTVVGMVVLSLT